MKQHQKNIPDFDIIQDVLNLAHKAFPTSVFISSLMQQYMERGSLSKKQLEGLHSKSSKIPDIAPGKLATIQAIILKKHSKHRSVITVSKTEKITDTKPGEWVAAVLSKYPEHKRVVYFKMKLDRKEALSALERTELERFYKLCLVK